jgi:hopanoid-associated phosphorylase
LPRLGVITGTRREAACLRSLQNSDQIDVACSGADAGRAGELAEKALSAGCTALLSFGVAGGLDPALVSGTLVLAESVIGPDGAKFSTDQLWRSAVAADLNAADIDFVTGTGLGVDEAIFHPEPKQLLFDGTKALCVDMESHSVMQVAREHRVPWLVIRVIADSAEDILPEIAMAVVDAGGGIRYGALAARLVRQPSEITDLISLWRISRRAFSGLGRVASIPSFRGPL